MSLIGGRVKFYQWLCLGIVLTATIGPDRVNAQAADLRAAVVENHIRYLPEGEGPFPTIVAIPGCSGIAFPDPDTEANHPDLSEDDRLFRAHYPRAAGRLSSSGYAVVLVHIHAAEGLVTACANPIRWVRIAEYIDAATAWAGELDFVDQSRLHVMGWSMGGGGVLRWLEASRPEWGRVKSAIVVYPGCRGIDSVGATVPLLMLLGGADDIARAEDCEEIVTRSPDSAEIQVHNFPGARHGYDVEGAPSRLDIGKGMTVGFQREAADETWRAVFSFLGGSGN